VQKVVYENEGT